jgi:hypothetical protein
LFKLSFFFLIFMSNEKLHVNMLFEFQISTKDMDVNQEEFEDTKGR